jgi:hypothetical protein
LTIAPDASYRIQYNTESGKLYFCYLPEGEELLTVSLGDEQDADDVLEDVEAEDVEVGVDDGRMDVEDEEEDIQRRAKKPKFK